MSLVDRVAEWPKPYIEQGREEGFRIGLEESIRIGREKGIRIGLEEAMAHERQLLRRIAATLFDSPTADRLAATIASESNPDRLIAVGEAIARCATGRELLREVGRRR